MTKNKTQQFAKFYIKDLKLKNIKNKSEKLEIDQFKFLSSVN